MFCLLLLSLLLLYNPSHPHPTRKLYTFFLNNKALRSHSYLYMLAIAGQTGPNELEFFEKTHSLKKIRFFPPGNTGHFSLDCLLFLVWLEPKHCRNG